MPTQVNIRQKRFVEKQKADGLKRVQMWLKPEEKAFLTDALEKLREGKTICITDNETDTNKNKIDKKQIIERIKSGQFTLKNRIPSPKYFSDFLNGPDLHWHKPLPDAILVVADHKKRTKEWRAVSLKGLGAFPVVWAIVFALNGYAFSKPKRVRTINLLSFDFENIISIIVGNAAMRSSDDLKDTPLGFCTYPLNVQSFRVPSDIENRFPEGVLTVVVDEKGYLRATNAFCDNIEQVTRWRITSPILDGIREIKEGWNPYMSALTKLFTY